MTRAAARHGAGEPVWLSGRKTPAQQDFNFVCSRPKGRSHSTKKLTLALALGLWPLLAAPGVSASIGTSPEPERPGLRTANMILADAHTYRHCHNLSRRTYCHREGRLPQNWPPNSNTPHRGKSKKAPCSRGAPGCSLDKRFEQG